MVKTKLGADQILTVYWFAVIFIVSGAVIYMVYSFYGSPFDVRVLEGRALGNQIADCLTSHGYISDQVFSKDFQSNFASYCHLNLTTEDFSNWKTNPQFYLEAEVYKFSPGQQNYGESGGSAMDIYGDQIASFSFGDPNLKTSWALSSANPNALISLPDLTPTRKVDYIVVHSTEGQTASGAIQTISERGLSIHYVIDRDGTIYSINNNPTSYTNAFVSDNDVAQHAGCIDPSTNAERPTCSVSCVSNGLLISSCQSYNNNPVGSCCIEGYNPKSIGIELVNLGDACTDSHYKDTAYCKNAASADGKQWESYSSSQINSLVTLVSDIASRYNVPLDRDHIIGHDQIAAFKQDPGPQFPWTQFMQDLNSRGAVAASQSQSVQGQQQKAFYALDKEGNPYLVKILTLVGKLEKNT
jgi:N-acetyl-anhydromuramyl-L-alanine amidase AmpD